LSTVYFLCYELRPSTYSKDKMNEMKISVLVSVKIEQKVQTVKC